MSELVPVLLAQGKKKELDLKDPRWQTREGKQLVAERYKKEMESLVEDTKAWLPVSLERSRFVRSGVPDWILQPRPVLTWRTKDGGTQEANCRCTLPGFKDPVVLDVVRDLAVCERSSAGSAVDRFLSFCADNRRRASSSFAGRHGGKAKGPNILFSSSKSEVGRTWGTSLSSGGLLRNSSLSSLVSISIRWTRVLILREPSSPWNGVRDDGVTTLSGDDALTSTTKSMAGARAGRTR